MYPLLEALEKPKEKSNRGEKKRTYLLNFPYKNKEEYLEDDQELTKTDTFRELSRITEIYDNTLKKIKFKTQEVRESDEEETNEDDDLMTLDGLSPEGKSKRKNKIRKKLLFFIYLVIILK